MAFFDSGATSLRRFCVEVASLLCRVPVGIVQMCMGELKVNNCYHNKVLSTPTRVKITSKCCPKDSDVEMSLTHRCLGETGDILCPISL